MIWLFCICSALAVYSIFGWPLVLGLCASARADFINTSYTTGFANSGVVPDGNVSGFSDTRTISTGGFSTIQHVSVTLNISGGYNGDLYAYLVHSSGFVVLLNRVGRTAGDGFGYDNTGFSATL